MQRPQLRFMLNFPLNPVLVKELRGRMRGARAYVFLTVMLLVMGGVGYGLYRIALAQYTGTGGSAFGPAVGQCIFVGLVFLALATICAIAPALTAGAISGEHEHKTFDLLAATPLRPASILLGKLLAALAYIMLIILAAAPLASLSYVFGGVSLRDMLRVLLLLIGVAVTFCIIGLFFSAWFRRTGAATVASYVVLALCLFGTGFVFVVVGIVTRSESWRGFLLLNPLSMVASALVEPYTNQTANLPPRQFLASFAGLRYASNTNTVPLWFYTAYLYAWFTPLVYLASTQLVSPLRRFRLPGARIYVRLTALLLVMGVIGYVLCRVAVLVFEIPRGTIINEPLGQCLFALLIALSAICIFILSPALVARTYSNQLDHEHLARVASALWHSAKILCRNTLVALAYTAPAILAIVPLLNLWFIFVGIIWSDWLLSLMGSSVFWLDFLKASFLLSEFALAFGGIGFLCSAWLRQAKAATILSYLLLAALILVPTGIYGYQAYNWFRLNSTGSDPTMPLPSRWWLLSNPISALASTISLPSLEILSRRDNSTTFWVVLMAIGGYLELDIPNRKAMLLTPLWRYSAVFYAWLSLMLYLINARLLNPLGRVRWWLIGLALLLSLALAPFVYWLITSEPISIVGR